MLAGKLLLLRTHDRLEAGLDAELAVMLLRVWLDYAATRLDEYAIAVQDQLSPPIRESDRPLVEPGSGPPPRTMADYLAAPTAYTSGDFLLAPIDLLQPRLVPDMVAGENKTALEGVRRSAEPTGKTDLPSTVPVDLLRAVDDIRDHPWRISSWEEALYLAEALALETIGRCAHGRSHSFDLETASARLILAELRQTDAALRERCVILRALAGEVLPRWLAGGAETGARHLGRDVLELEALKAEVRSRLRAAWQVFGAALGRNSDVQASCFALAEATAWLKAADATLGRMAWLSRLCQAEDRDEPAARQDLGRRVLAHGHAEVRDRLRRFDEDLAALRRGYYAPHVRAADLLRTPPAERPTPPPGSVIERPLRVLVVVEPLPAVLPSSAENGEHVLESYWTLGAADRAALENALRCAMRPRSACASRSRPSAPRVSGRRCAKSSASASIASICCFMSVKT